MEILYFDTAEGPGMVLRVARVLTVWPGMVLGVAGIFAVGPGMVLGVARVLTVGLEWYWVLLES